jgi:protein TonB
MKLVAAAHINRDEVAGFVAALVLHSLVLFGIWRYQVIPSPPVDSTVFVSLINPAAPARVNVQVAPKPALVSRETPKPVAAKPAPVRLESLKPVVPATPQLQVGAAPVNLPAVQASPQTTVVKTHAVAATVSSPSVYQSAGASQPLAAATQPVLNKDELSVICSDQTQPVYPKLSLRLGEQGKTVLLVELDERGRVANVTVKTKSGFPRLDEAAVNAVKSWHCSPAKRNGVAVRSVASQPFTFTLKGR